MLQLVCEDCSYKNNHHCLEQGMHSNSRVSWSNVEWVTLMKVWHTESETRFSWLKMQH